MVNLGYALYVSMCLIGTSQCDRSNIYVAMYPTFEKCNELGEAALNARLGGAYEIVSFTCTLEDVHNHIPK